MENILIPSFCPQTALHIISRDTHIYMCVSVFFFIIIIILFFSVPN